MTSPNPVAAKNVNAEHIEEHLKLQRYLERKGYMFTFKDGNVKKTLVMVKGHNVKLEQKMPIRIENGIYVSLLMMRRCMEFHTMFNPQGHISLP